MTGAEPTLRLRPLDLDDARGRQVAAAVRQVHGDALVDAAGIADRLFTLEASTLPGLSFTGGQSAGPWPDPALPGGRLSFGGTGLTPAASFAGCIGEGIELISQFECESDVTPGADMPAPITNLLAELGADGSDRIAGIDAIDGKGAWLPAALCLRRDPARHPWRPPWPLSCGCAAGADRESAAMRAVLELVERDAVALWWDGGARGRPLSTAAATAAAETRNRLRGRTGRRIDWALDITTDLGIPVVVALSADGNGRGLACGFAARPDAAAAAVAATLEMAQVELGLLIARTKKIQGGDAALTAPDRRHIERADFDIPALPILQPYGPAAVTTRGPETLGRLVRHLAAFNIGLWLADLSRPRPTLPVMRALAPALQPFPSARIGTRLAAACERHGGGPGATGLELI
jgi:ribosomal protein S12 methylthiotransferase accessory factor